MGNKTDIIFTSLPSYLDPIARGLRHFGYRVFYIRLSNTEYSLERAKNRADALQVAGIIPLPLERLPRLNGVRSYFSDPENQLQNKTNELAPIGLLQGLKDLYPNNDNVVAKLRIVVRTVVAGQFETANIVNLWATAHPDRMHLLIYPDAFGLLAPKLCSNVRLLVFPVEMLRKGMGTLVQLIHRVLRKIIGNVVRNDYSYAPAPKDSRNLSASRIVFVTHQGLSYGELFQKTLFYSEHSDSERHPEKLLHFDYSDFPSPSEKIKWVCLNRQPQSLLSNFCAGMNAMSRGIIRVRGFKQTVGLLILTRAYVSFMSYAKKLEPYPGLRVALIDYDILCPKALLLAFESKGIKTVAAQERFFLPFYSTMGSILNTYLCGSEYIEEVMRKSSSYCVDQHHAVGQYRSDDLHEARKLEVPQILQKPLAQGRKIITALGFNTHLDWYNSQTDPLLSWTAHRHFLMETIQLSLDIPEAFIILRYKFVNWISLPVFAEVVEKIQSSENMTISVDYEKSLFSYALCAYSHLVIAKHTSLGDECLAVGIPVLFHEYTYNTERLVADAFDYRPTRVMCFNYQELLERSRIILGGDLHAMTPDYDYLKNVVFGGLGDGKVKERIRAHIDSLLAQ